jgi:hypothetical protein
MEGLACTALNRKHTLHQFHKIRTAAMHACMQPGASAPVVLLNLALHISIFLTSSTPADKAGGSLLVENHAAHIFKNWV